MLERNNVWEYGEGSLQACISSSTFEILIPELARVTNSARLFTPGEKDSIADSKVGVIVGWVVISLISKIWMFIRSGKGKNYQKIHVRKLK